MRLRMSLALAMGIVLVVMGRDPGASTGLSLGSVAQAQSLRERLSSTLKKVLGRVWPDSSPQACQTRLLAIAQKRGWKHEMKDGLLFVAIPASARSGSYARACGKNVIEFWKKPRADGGYHHLFTRLYRDNWSRINDSLDYSGWENRGNAIGVLSALEPKVASRTRAFLNDNARNPRDPTNRFGTIGTFNVGGGSGGPDGTTHCTNYWNCAQVGENGETMPELHGLKSTGIASNFIQELMRSGSQRIFAVTVYGDPPDFSDSTLQKYFK